jgi:hypothetical protein
MWQAQLMTDYHSPWRFPPLKPYSEEIPPAVMGQQEALPGVLRPVSATIESHADDRPRSFSRHLELMSQ